MPADDKPEITIEVAYATPGAQTLLTLGVPRGCTAAQAIERSGLLQRHPEIDWPRVALGIFSRKVGGDAVLRDGDRVEVYRALRIDPKARRRERARQ